MNTLTIVGNLANEPRVIYTADGLCIAHFSIAGNGWKPSKDNPKGEKTVIFWDCTLFGDMAERFGNEATKGREFTLKGVCIPDNYVDKNGNKVYKIAFNAESYKKGRLPRSKDGVDTANANNIGSDEKR